MMYQSEQMEEIESPRRWGLPASIWLLIAGFCGIIEIAGVLSTDCHINHWSDVVVSVTFALVGSIALLNALLLLAGNLRRN